MNDYQPSESDEHQSFPLPHSQLEPFNVAVQVAENSQAVQIGAQSNIESPQASSDVILDNLRPVYRHNKEAKRAAERKRSQKEEIKRIAKAAKKHGRANRDENMDFLAAYYKEKFTNIQFKEFRRVQDHPTRVLGMLKDPKIAKKMSKFVRNCQHRAKS